MNFLPNTDQLSLLFAASALVLLVTSELISPYYGKVNLSIDRKKLRNCAITFSILFLATVIAKIAQILNA
jgi:hypothetical protein